MAAAPSVSKSIAFAAAWLLVAAVLLVVGGWTCFFGLACFLGGPCPRPGDLHLHLIYGTLWSAVGVGLALLGWKAGRVARDHGRRAKGSSGRA